MDDGGGLKKDLRCLLNFTPAAPPLPDQNYCKQSCNFYIVIKATELDDYAHKNNMSTLGINESVLHNIGSLIFYRMFRERINATGIAVLEEYFITIVHLKQFYNNIYRRGFF